MSESTGDGRESTGDSTRAPSARSTPRPGTDPPTSTWHDDPAWPPVDIVIPVRNEAADLADSVAAVLDQEYPGTLRVCIAVAPSSDGTEMIAATLAEGDDRITVVANPAGVTPAGLNAAIRAGEAPVVVRVDGHSALSPGYIGRAVETLRRTGAANVGGMQVPDARTPFERAVAAATTSRLGTGGATYRTGGAEGPVDTVYLGVFDRAAIESVGLFDERLIRNQDYELNIRLRAAGHTVWFDPELRVAYRPRGSWRALASQYFEYGEWKAAVARAHPSSLRARQVIPPFGLAAVVAASIGALRRPALAIVPLAGAAVVGVEAARAARRAGASTLATAAALATIPTSWTLGLIRGLVRSPLRRF